MRATEAMKATRAMEATEAMRATEAMEAAMGGKEGVEMEFTTPQGEPEATVVGVGPGMVEVVAVWGRRRTAARWTRPWRSWPWPSPSSRSLPTRQQRRRRRSSLLPCSRRPSQPPTLTSSYSCINLYNKHFLFSMLNSLTNRHTHQMKGLWILSKFWGRF